MLEEYKTVKRFGTAQMIEKKSKFIANVKPIKSEEEAIEFINSIKSEHWNATHNVYAYVLGENNNIQRYTDDGEPSGTAGIPMLDIMLKEEIKDTVVVVTRYFGGTLLGTGGLVRAYGGCAKLGLEVAGIILRKLYQNMKVEISYELLGKIQNKLINENITLQEIEYTDKVTIPFLIEPQKIEKLSKDIKEITSGNVELISICEKYVDIDISQ